MAYTKPQVIAQNASTGSYAAGCPTNTRTWTPGNKGYDSKCRACEITN